MKLAEKSRCLLQRPPRSCHPNTQVTSRHGLSVSSLLRKLQKSIHGMQNTKGQGERAIAYGQKEMSNLASKLSEKMNMESEIEPSFLAVIKSALDQSDDLARQAMKKLDQLAREKEVAKAFVSARPKMVYETFLGDVSQYPTTWPIRRSCSRRSPTSMRWTGEPLNSS